MIAPGPAELLAMSFVVLPQSLAAAFIAKRKGRRFWTSFLLSIAITIGAALVMIFPYICGGTVGRLLAVAAVFLTAPIISLFMKRRALPIPDHPAAKVVPDAPPPEMKGWVKAIWYTIRYTIFAALVILTLMMLVDFLHEGKIREIPLRAIMILVILNLSWLCLPVPKRPLPTSFLWAELTVACVYLAVAAVWRFELATSEPMRLRFLLTEDLFTEADLWEAGIACVAFGTVLLYRYLKARRRMNT